MATQVQRRKGTTVQHSTFTGASAELTVDTTKNTVVVHNGATAGGFPLAKESGSALSPSSLSLPNGTANAVPYLNGSKVLTTGSALTFDGTNLQVGTGTASATRTLNVLGSQSIERYGATPQLAIRGGTDSTTGKDVRFNLTQNSLSISAATIGGAQNPWLAFDFTEPSTLFYTDGTERMRLTSTGLGIGTSSPTDKLSVGTSSGATQLKIQSGSSINNCILHTNGTVDSWRVGMNLSLTNGSYEFYDDINNVTRLTLDSSGNLGLGVTPSAWSAHKILQVGAWASFGSFNGNLNSQVMNNAYWDGGAYRYIGSTNAAYYSQTTGVHSWFNAPSGTAGAAITFTQAMTLDASGNLGIGVTSPGARLDVNGGGGLRVLDSPATSSQINIGVGLLTAGRPFVGTNTNSNAMEVGTRAGVDLIFVTTSTERARIDTSGNLIHSAPTTPPTLATNGQMVFNLTSNTNLRVSVRGSDGVTRTANLTLA